MSAERHPFPAVLEVRCRCCGRTLFLAQGSCVADRDVETAWRLVRAATELGCHLHGRAITISIAEDLPCASSP